MTAVSAVRSHNVPRVSKSYESFGERFTTTIIDDIATSDFSEAVKGLYRANLLSTLEAECILGVDAIIHVASPLHQQIGRKIIGSYKGT